MTTTKTSAATTRRQRGVSLIETLMVLAVTAVSLGAALPGLEDLRQRRHFDGVAAQLETDLHMARGLAVAQNRSVRISFKADAAGTCYVVHTGPANACTCNLDGTASCSAGEIAMRSVRLGLTEAVQLRSNVPSILFDSAKGTSTPTGTLRLMGKDQRAVHLVVNIMGRVRSCSPDSAVPGYKAC
jgi:type IV fimbrial biogenesis protein FimT